MRFIFVQLTSSCFWNGKKKFIKSIELKIFLFKIVPDHDCNEAEKNRFFNFSSTGISQDHQVFKNICCYSLMYFIILIKFIIFQALIIKRENGTYPWESIVTELFLVCDQASKVQTLFVIGILAEIFSILSKFFNCQ